MSSNPSKTSPGRSQLFHNIKFWVSKAVRGYKDIQQRISDHGGTIAPYDKKADICLVDPDRLLGQSSRNCYNYRLVDHAISKGQMPNLEEHVVTMRTTNDRPVGSSSATGRKNTRTAFTIADDKILLQRVLPMVKKYGPYKGNEVYQQIATDHPHHTYQSWRSRFLDHVLPAYHKSLQDLPLSTGAVDDEEQEDFPVERPTKRRRTDVLSPARTDDDHQDKIAQHDRAEKHNNPQNVLRISDGDAQAEAINNCALACPDQDLGSLPVNETHLSSSVENLEAQSSNVDLTRSDARRQGLKVTNYVRQKSKELGFSPLEAYRLYKAVPDICGTPHAKIDESWRALAEDEAWKGHTADEWRHFYTEVILFEYMRRNHLNNEIELQHHAAQQRESETDSDSVTPRIKRESTLDFRTPAEKQLDRELLRAQLENEIVFSEISQESQKPQHGPVTEHASGHALHPDHDQLYSQLQRPEVSANEGRKRSSQQTASTDGAVDRRTPHSESSPTKRRLFGNVLDRSQLSSQNLSEPDLLLTEPRTETKQPDPSSFNSTEQSVTDASACSLPTAQKPPRSYQPQPRSQIASQATDRQDDNVEKTTAAAPTPTVLNTQITFHASEEATSPVLDLLGDGTANSIESVSDHDESDTGSEYQYFDTVPEPPQAWETAPAQPDDPENTDRSDLEDDTEAESTTETQSHRKRRRPTPLPARNPARQMDTENGAKYESNEEVVIEHPSKIKIASRVETQVLFVHQYQEESVEFDVPPPEGGWEAIEDVAIDEQDPDLPISSVELVEEANNVRRRLSSPIASETASSSSIEPQDDVARKVVLHKPPVVYDISSVDEDNGDETEDTESDIENRTVVKRAKAVGNVSRQQKISSATIWKSAGKHSPPSARSSTVGSVTLTYVKPDGIPRKDSIKAWMNIQHSKYDKVPVSVLNRLASVASQATSLNLPSAAWLLMHLVKAFEDGEAKRREAHLREQKRLKSEGCPTKQFKPRTKLGTEDAEAWLPCMAGTWTPNDDEHLFSGLPDRIRLMEEKHTKDEVQKRTKFLRNRWGLGQRELTKPTHQQR